MNFSKPVDPSKKSIDISTDKVTTAIRLPDDVPHLEGGILFISDGVMHMLPGNHSEWKIADEDGNTLNTNTSRVDLERRVWDFDLQTHQWSVLDSGTEDRPSFPAVAFDVEKQVGWYYGGLNISDYYLDGDEGDPYVTESQNLYRLDRGERTPVIVETDSSLVGGVVGGELVYIGGPGEAGVLVLIRGSDEWSSVSDPDPLILLYRRV